MQNENAILKREVVGSLPKALITEIMRGIDWAYQESYTSTNNSTLYGDAQKKWIYPYQRRAILEKRIWDIARNAGEGVTAKTQSNVAGNHEYTEISAGRMVFTCSHHTGERGSILRSSIFRKQSAKLNSLISQMDLGFQEFLEADDGSPIYGIILYGHDLKQDSKAGYARLAFPPVDYSDSENWVWFDLHELVAAYPHAVITNDDEELIVTWKNKIRSQEL